MDDPNQFAVKQNTVPMHMTEERSQMLNEHQMQSAHMQAQQNMTEVQPHRQRDFILRRNCYRK